MTRAAPTAAASATERANPGPIRTGEGSGGRSAWTETAIAASDMLVPSEPAAEEAMMSERGHAEGHGEGQRKRPMMIVEEAPEGEEQAASEIGRDRGINVSR